MRLLALLLVGLLLVVVACQQRPPSGKYPLKKVAFEEVLRDDLELEPLLKSLQEIIPILESASFQSELYFGETTFTGREYAKGLRALLEYTTFEKDTNKRLRWMKDFFDFYVTQGKKKPGKAFITSYYEPVLDGSKNKTLTHSTPLLSYPDDLIRVSTSDYDSRLSKVRRMRGRLVRDEKGRQTLLPYYEREELERLAHHKYRKHILAWVDPIDAFFLHIQGSGTVLFDENKTLRLGYDEQNGHVYRAIGKYLDSVIPLEELTLLNMESYIRGLAPLKRNRLLNKNPSYVFFRELDGPPKTYMNTDVVAGRTIATDERVLPKGALGYLEFKKPVFIGPYLDAPAKWEPTSRLVLDQDTGGAIRGAARLDLFWGKGNDAKRHAAVMKQWGKLYYLAPKPERLAQLQTPASIDAP